jgi:hexosaminidase
MAIMLVSVAGMSGLSGQTPSALSAGNFVNTLMPQPRQFSAREGRLAITPSFAVYADHFRDERLDGAMMRMLERIKYRTSLLMPTTLGSEGGSATLLVSVEGPGETIQTIDENESYRLEVTPTGARLRAETVVGAMRGLETFEQLIESDATGYFLPAISIEDAPRFRWRGLMIDCGRHFIPVDVLKRTLDGMAAVKLNVFHWHLSEDQGFRMESRVFPKLTGMGSDGVFYTQEQAREIVTYAKERGIRVVPEFDMPGHSSAWFVGYPELASGPGPFHIEREFGVFDPVMDPTRESTYRFLGRFVAEMVTIFPDLYWHIGGDENNGVEWKANPQIQHFMQAHNLKDTAALQNYFNQRLLQILEKHGKRMIGWDEVLTPDLPKNVVVQTWRGADSLAAGAKSGYLGILSAGYYLNHKNSAETHYAVDPLPATSTLNADEQARILGGEACLWTEQTGPLTVDSRVWPRMAAIAERLWSPRNVTGVDETGIDDMYRRLDVESVRLEALGLTHLAHEQIGLRQLAGAQDISALEVLTSVLEPITFDEQARAQHPNQRTPLSHLTDALVPDPPSRHLFQKLVKSYLQNPAERKTEADELISNFKNWQEARPRALEELEISPELAAARDRAVQLGELGAVGMEAVALLSSNTPAMPGWKLKALAELDAVAKPISLVRFTVTAGLRELVSAVVERPTP